MNECIMDQKQIILIIIIHICLIKNNLSHEIILSNDHFIGYISENQREQTVNYIRFIDFNKPKLEILDSPLNVTQNNNVWNSISLTNTHADLFTVQLVQPTQTHTECYLQIRVNKVDYINREAQDEYFIISTLSVHSMENGMYTFVNKTNTIQLKFTIRILDDNDNDPIFDSYEYSIELDEIKDYESDINGLKIAQVKASDADLGLNSQLNYYLDTREYAKLFLVNWQNGEIYLTRNVVNLNRDEYLLDIKVSDSGPKYTPQMQQLEDVTRVNIHVKRHTQEKNKELFKIIHLNSIESFRLDLPTTGLIVHTLEIKGPIYLFDLKTDNTLFSLHLNNDTLIITYDLFDANGNHTLRGDLQSFKILNCFKINSSKCFELYEFNGKDNNLESLIEKHIKNHCLLENESNEIRLLSKYNQKSDDICMIFNDLMKVTYSYDVTSASSRAHIEILSLRLTTIHTNNSISENQSSNRTFLKESYTFDNQSYQLYECLSSNYYQYELDKCPISNTTLLVSTQHQKTLDFIELRLVNNQNNNYSRRIMFKNSNLNQTFIINHTLWANDGLIPRNTVLFRLNIPYIDVNELNTSDFYMTNTNELVNRFDIKFDLFEISTAKSKYYEITLKSAPIRIHLQIRPHVKHGYTTRTISYPKVYLRRSKLVYIYSVNNSTLDISREIVFVNEKYKLNDVYNVTYSLDDDVHVSNLNNNLRIDTFKGIVHVRNKRILSYKFKIKINFNAFNILSFDLSLVVEVLTMTNGQLLNQVTCNKNFKFAKIDLSYAKWSSEYIRYEKSYFYIDRLLITSSPIGHLISLTNFELKINNSLVSQMLHFNENNNALYLNDANRNILKLRGKHRNLSSLVVALDLSVAGFYECAYELELKLKRDLIPAKQRITHTSNYFAINTNNLLTYVQFGNEFIITLSINENSPPSSTTGLIDLPSYFKSKFSQGKMNVNHLNAIVDSLTFSIVDVNSIESKMREKLSIKRHFNISQLFILKHTHYFDYEIQQNYAFKIRVEQLLDVEDINYDNEFAKTTLKQKICHGDCKRDNTSHYGYPLTFTYWLDVFVQVKNEIDEPFVTTWPAYHLTYDHSELLSSNRDLFLLEIIDFDSVPKSNDLYKARITSGGEFFYFNGMRLNVDKRALTYDKSDEGVLSRQELDVEISDYGLSRRRLAYCKIFINIKNTPPQTFVQHDLIQIYDYVFNINKPLVDLNEHLGRIQSNYKLVRVRALNANKALRKKLRKIRLNNLFFINSNGYLHSNLRHLPCSNCTFQVVFNTDSLTNHTLRFHVNHLKHVDKLLQRYERKINNSAIVRTFRLKTRSHFTNVETLDDTSTQYPKHVYSIDVNRSSVDYHILNFIIFQKDIDIFTVNQNNGQVYLIASPRENLTTSVIIQIDNHLGQIEFFNLTVRINCNHKSLDINRYFSSISTKNNKISVILNDTTPDLFIINAFKAFHQQENYVYSLVNCFYMSTQLLLPRTNELCRPEFLRFDGNQAKFMIDKRNFINYLKNSSDFDVYSTNEIRFYIDYSFGDGNAVFDLTRVILEMNVSEVKVNDEVISHLKKDYITEFDLIRLKLNVQNLTFTLDEFNSQRILANLNDFITTQFNFQAQPVKLRFSIESQNQYLVLTENGLLYANASISKPICFKFSCTIDYFYHENQDYLSDSKEISINVVKSMNDSLEATYDLTWIDNNIQIDLKLSSSQDYSPIFYSILPQFNVKNYLNEYNNAIQFMLSETNSNFMIDSKTGFIYHSSRFNDFNRNMHEIGIQACDLIKCTKENLILSIRIRAKNEKPFEIVRSFSYSLKSIQSRNVLNLDSVFDEANILVNNSYELINYKNLFEITTGNMLSALNPVRLYDNYTIEIIELKSGTLLVINLTIDFIERINQTPKWYFVFDGQLVELSVFQHKLNLTFSFNDLLRSSQSNPLISLNAQTWIAQNKIYYDSFEFIDDSKKYEGLIQINAKTGDIYLNESSKINEIPYEEQVVFKARALDQYDGFLHAYSDYLTVYINFTLNESSEESHGECKFEKDFYHFKINEFYSPNLVIGHVRVDQSGNFTYEIESGNDYNEFILDYRTGEFRTRTPYLEHNRQSNYLLIIKASSSQSTYCNSQTTNVFINLTKIDDNYHGIHHLFENYKYDVQIPENYNSFEAIFEFDVKNVALKDRISFELLNNNEVFTLDKLTGQLYVRSILDYENPLERRVFYLNINALNHGKVVSNCVLVVRLSNVNDNRPQFSQSLFKFKVSSDSTFVGRVNAFDLDDETQLVYNTNDQNHFQINEFGVLSCSNVSKLHAGVYNFSVWVTDGIYTSFSSVMVEVVPKVNSHLTMSSSNPFNQSVYSCEVSEDALPGTHIITLTSFKNLSSSLKFYIINGDLFNQFSITNDAKLYTSKLLDRELNENYTLTILASYDDGSSSNTYKAQVILKINDINDNRPTCASKNGMSIVKLNINEDEQKVFEFDAYDNDENDDLTYSLVSENIDELIPFEIQNQTVQRKLPLAFIYTDKRSYCFYVQIRDSNNNECKIKVLINLVRNSNATLKKPQFTSKEYYYEFKEESLGIGYVLSSLDIKAYDYNFNTKMFYSLVEPSKYVQIDAQNAFVTLTDRFDHEEMGDWLNVTLQATSISLDDSRSFAKSMTKLALRIVDINDNQPYFKQEVIELEIPENSVIGSVVGHVKVFDRDSSLNISYALDVNDLDSSYFTINSTNGDLIVSKKLDYEVKSLYFFNVTAKEDKYETHTLVIIKLIDLNDNPPMFDINKTKIELSIAENSPANTTFGILTAHDFDSNSPILYRISSGNSLSLFEIDASTGRLFTTQPIDYEEISENNQFELIVEAIERETLLSTSIQVKVTILDIYDKKPKFKHQNATLKISSNERLGRVIYNFDIIDIDDESKSNYTILIVEQYQTTDQNHTTRLDSQIFALNQNLSLILISHPVAGFKYILKLRVYNGRMLHSDTCLFIQVLKFESQLVIVDVSIVTLDRLIYPQKGFELYQLNYSKKHFYEFAHRRESQNSLISLDRHNGSIRLADDLRITSNLKLKINQLDTSNIQQAKTKYHLNFKLNAITSNCIENSLFMKINFMPMTTEAKFSSFDFMNNGLLSSLFKSIHHLIDFKLRFNQIQLVSLNHKQHAVDSIVSIEMLFTIYKYNSTTNCFKSKFIHSMLHEKRIEIMKNFKSSIDFSVFRFKVKLSEFSFNRKCIMNKPIVLLSSSSNLCSSSKCKLTFPSKDYQSYASYILPTFDYDCKVLALSRRQNKCKTKENPCKNSAICRQVKSSQIGSFDYHCFCPNGFTGRNCELDINECEQLLPPFNQKPCAPKATCVNTYGSFMCNCTSSEPSSCYTQTFYYAAASKNFDEKLTSLDRFLLDLTTNTKETLLGVFGGIAAILLIILITSVFVFKLKYAKKPLSNSTTPSHEMVASSVINTSMTTNSTVPPTPMHNVKVNKTNFIKSLFIRHSIPNSSTHSRNILLKKDINSEEHEMNMNEFPPKRTSTDIDEQDEIELSENTSSHVSNKDYEQVKNKMASSMTSLSSDAGRVPPMKFNTTGQKKRDVLTQVHPNFNSFSNRRKSKAKKGNIFAKLMMKRNDENNDSIVNLSEDGQDFYWDITDWAAGSLLLNKQESSSTNLKTNEISMQEQPTNLSSDYPLYSQVNKSNAYGTLTNENQTEEDTSFNSNEEESKIVNNYIYLLNDEETAKLVDDKSSNFKESALSSFNKLKLVHGSLSSILNGNYSILNEHDTNESDSK